MLSLLSEIAKVVSGKLIGEDLAVDITQISINTRTLQTGDVYIAIKGAQFDGNDFVADAVSAGASAAIVEKDVSSSVPVIRVTDTRLALRQLATFWRQTLALKIAGVTGSNGKTSVKEMLAQVLATQGSVLFTQGNLNNDIGVPLTLLRLREQHQFAVIEMGANHPGEIAYTSACVSADVGIITNVGAAHIEGFGSLAGVAKTKGELLQNLKPTGTAVLNRDDAFYEFWCGLVGKRAILTFGLAGDADVSARAIKVGLVQAEFITQFELTTPQGNIDIRMHLAGRHNVLNALAVSAAALALGLSLTQIQQGLAAMRPVKGRMQPLLGLKGNVVINDTYNANPSSLKAAVAVLLESPGEPWVALGAFGELGADSENIHAEMGEYLKNSGVKRLFATGALAQATVNAFGAGGQFFTEQRDLISTLQHELTPEAIILCKGSRLQKMENVVAGLCEPTGN